MCRRLLPLNALRAFEVAARHKSLAKAAEELAVTPAAVHHQVKSLEEYIGVDLFLRKGNNLELTKSASAVLPTLEGAFDLLSLVIERLRQHANEAVLKLSTPPSFAQKWLVPKLGRFREEFEKIELRVSTTDDFPDLMNSEIDVAIGFGLEHQFKDPAVVAELLLNDEVVPVCSPDFRNKHQLLSESELLDTELLHDDNLLSRQGIGWDTWFSELGIRIRNAHENIKFDSTVLTIDAAMAGQGVALAPRSLVEHDLSSGRLVRPFERSIPMDSGYFVAHLEMISDRPAIIAFREWLFAEASINRELLSARLKASQTSCILN